MALKPSAWHGSIYMPYICTNYKKHLIIFLVLGRAREQRLSKGSTGEPNNSPNPIVSSFPENAGVLESQLAM